MPTFDQLERKLARLRDDLGAAEQAFLATRYASIDNYDDALRSLWILRDSVSFAEDHLTSIKARLAEYDPYDTTLLASGEEGSYYDAATTIVFPDFPRASLGPRDLSANAYNILIVDASVGLLPYLKEDPERLRRLTPQELEDFVLERLDAFGFQVRRVGKVYQRDGGVDLVAIAPSPIPYLLVAQVKSHVNSKARTGLPDAQRFYGVGSQLHAEQLPCKFGLLVTNSGFTRPALEWMEEEAICRWLRRAAFDELCQWLLGVFLVRPDQGGQKLPSSLRIPGGPTVDLTGGKLLDGFGRELQSRSKGKVDTEKE